MSEAKGCKLRARGGEEKIAAPMGVKSKRERAILSSC